MNRTEITGAISLAFVYVLRMLGLFMVMPVMASLGQSYPDYSPLMVGIAIGGYGLTQALCQIPFGVLSDKIGRKPIIIVGLFLFAVGSFISAQAELLSWVVIGRLLQGTGAIASATMALAGDISRESQRPKVMAIIGIAIGFSFYLALFIGPFIANHWGLSGVFYTTALLAASCIPLVLWVVPSSEETAPSRDTLPQPTEIVQLLFNPNLMRLNISVCLLHVMITWVFFQLPNLFVQSGWALNQHWQLYLIVLISSILGLTILMKLSKKHGVKLMLHIALCLLITSLILFAFESAAYFGVLIATIVFFTGFNYLEANFPALVSSIAPVGKRGSAMGLFTSFQFFGAFAGGSLAGLLFERLGLTHLYISAAIICVGWIFIMRGLNTSKKIKRLTLSISHSQKSETTIQNNLMQIAGVIDVVLVPSERAFYLKVDTDNFDLAKAKRLI